jgi:hypothetical protein
MRKARRPRSRATCTLAARSFSGALVKASRTCPGTDITSRTFAGRCRERGSEHVSVQARCYGAGSRRCGTQNDAAVCVPVVPDDGGSAGASPDASPGASPSCVASDHAADVRGNSDESVATCLLISATRFCLTCPRCYLPLACTDAQDYIREAPDDGNARGDPHDCQQARQTCKSTG